MQNRDMVVIGASAGGIEAMKTICAAFPADLNAAVLVVIHTSAHADGVVPQILGGAGPLLAKQAWDGQKIQKGQIAIAPPDHHMLVEDGHLRVLKGPRENRHRPAVDPTFRSAAMNYGRRVIGVVLSGALDDGTSGLMVISARGGEAIVQDPSTAQFPDMPASALMRVPEARVVPLNEIADVIVKLVSEVVEEAAQTPGATELPAGSKPVQHTKNAEYHMPELEGEFDSGEPSQFGCPECGGVLWEIDQNGFTRFRCRVGHAYTAEYLNSEQHYALEMALWAGLRTLEESASLYKRMANRAGADSGAAYNVFMQRAADAEANAKILRDFLTRVGNTGVEESQEDVA